MAKTYFVIGGVYQDTHFQQAVCKLEKLGPFASYEEARKVWQEKSLAHVDDACCRYTIEEEQTKD